MDDGSGACYVKNDGTQVTKFGEDGTKMQDVMIEGLSFTQSIILTISKLFTPWRERNSQVLEGVGKYSFPKNPANHKEKSMFVIKKEVDCGIFTGQILDPTGRAPDPYNFSKLGDTVLYGHGILQRGKQFHEGYFDGVKAENFTNSEQQRVGERRDFDFTSPMNDLNYDSDEIFGNDFDDYDDEYNY